jgi:hypothetical protein
MNNVHLWFTLNFANLSERLNSIFVGYGCETALKLAAGANLPAALPRE